MAKQGWNWDQTMKLKGILNTYELTNFFSTLEELCRAKASEYENLDENFMEKDNPSDLDLEMAIHYDKIAEHLQDIQEFTQFIDEHE